MYHPEGTTERHVDGKEKKKLRDMEGRMKRSDKLPEEKVEMREK